MKGTGIAILAGCCSAAWAVNPVSVFEFKGNLNASPISSSNARSLEYSKGSGATFGPAGHDIVFETQTVGTNTKQVAQFAQGESFKAYHGIGSNGGGSYGNVYSILWDVKLNQQDWSGLYNTNETNNNDSDLFVDGTGALGISGDYAGTFAFGQWQRVVGVFDLTKSLATIYLNGTKVNDITIGGVDGRWALYTYNDPDPGDLYEYALIFGDNDLAESASGYVSQIAFYDVALTQSQINELGPVGNPVPEPATLLAMATGIGWLTARRRKRA